MHAAARTFAFVAALGVKLLAAALPLYYLHVLGRRFAESWMGTRAPLEGFGGGVLVTVGVVLAFVASSALAALGCYRACVLRACGATALLVTASAAIVFLYWIAMIPSPSRGAAMIRDGTYNKSPPILAAIELEDVATPCGLAVLVLDIALTIGIVRSCTVRAVRVTAPADTAGTSSGAS